MDYEKLYRLLFHACTDAAAHIDRQDFGCAKQALVSAQQQAEECCLSQEDPE